MNGIVNINQELSLYDLIVSILFVSRLKWYQALTISSRYLHS